MYFPAKSLIDASQLLCSHGNTTTLRSNFLQIASEIDFGKYHLVYAQIERFVIEVMGQTDNDLYVSSAEASPVRAAKTAKPEFTPDRSRMRSTATRALDFSDPASKTESDDTYEAIESDDTYEAIESNDIYSAVVDLDLGLVGGESTTEENEYMAPVPLYVELDSSSMPVAQTFRSTLYPLSQMDTSV